VLPFVFYCSELVTLPEEIEFSYPLTPQGIMIKCRELSARISKDSEGGLLKENFGDYSSHASG
jgi:hypothetical protein